MTSRLQGGGELGRPLDRWPSETALVDEDTASAHGLVLFRSATGDEISPDAEDEVARATAGPGVPLPAHVGAGFARSLGTSLDGVRIHDDAAAAGAAAAVGARAFTVGNDIYFGSGQYDPDGAGGRHLLAHEVAHTVQQAGGSRAGRAQYKLEVSRPGDALEDDADRVASDLVSGRPTSVSGGGTPARLMRYVSSPPEAVQARIYIQDQIRSARTAEDIAGIVRALEEPNASTGMVTVQLPGDSAIAIVDLDVAELLAEARAKQRTIGPEQSPEELQRGAETVRTSISRAEQTEQIVAILNALSAATHHRGGDAAPVQFETPRQTVSVWVERRVVPALTAEAERKRDELARRDDAEGREEVWRRQFDAEQRDSAQQEETRRDGRRQLREQQRAEQADAREQERAAEQERRERAEAAERERQEQCERTPAPSSPRVDGLLEDIGDKYFLTLIRRRDAIADVERDADARDPTPQWVDVALFVGNIALASATAGISQAIAGALTAGIRAAAENATEAASSAMAEAVQESVKTATEQTLGSAYAAAMSPGSAGSDPKTAFFRGLRDACQSAAEAAQEEFNLRGRARIRCAQDPEAEARRLHRAVDQGLARAQVIQRRETLEAWTNFLARTSAGTHERQSGPQPRRGTDLRSTLGASGILDLQCYITDEDAPLRIQRASIFGLNEQLRDEMEVRRIADLGISYKVWLIHRAGSYSWDIEIGRNEAGTVFRHRGRLYGSERSDGLADEWLARRGGGDAAAGVRAVLTDMSRRTLRDEGVQLTGAWGR